MNVYVKILDYDVNICDKNHFTSMQLIIPDHVVHPLLYKTWQEYISVTNNVWLHGLIINFGEKEPV